jgi:hypothetical protein
MVMPLTRLYQHHLLAAGYTFVGAQEQEPGGTLHPAARPVERH